MLDLNSLSAAFANKRVLVLYDSTNLETFPMVRPPENADGSRFSTEFFQSKTLKCRRKVPMARKKAVKNSSFASFKQQIRLVKH